MSRNSNTEAGSEWSRSDRVCRADLSSAVHPVAAARAFIDEVLDGWRVGGLAREDATLVASELVANAMMHAGGPLVFSLRREDSAVRLEITDASPVAPAPRGPVRGQPGGHGLVIVQRLCRAWGSTPLAEGKVVWAEIDTGPEPRFAPSPAG